MMKKCNPCFVITFLCLMLISGCDGDNCRHFFPADTVRQLDETIEAKMQDMNLPGAAVAVWVPCEGEYFCAKGLANLETDEFRNLLDPFRIASITKTFVATAVLQLVDDGVLNTSDKLSEFFPTFHNADKITIRNLLRMRSGIADFADETFLETVYNDPLADYSAQDLIDMSAARADQFEEPDQTTRYCNVNYVLLGEIVKKITGNDIGVQIRQRIIEPLGMANTIYPVNSDLPGRLHGYSWNADALDFDDKTILNPLWVGAAGAMISDIADLKIYARALYSGRLLSQAVQQARLETMPMEDAPDWIGYGEGLLKIGKFWGHNGTIFGFSTEMWYLPEKDAVILINVNRLDMDDESKSTDLFFAVAKILFPEYVDW